MLHDVDKQLKSTSTLLGLILVFREIEKMEKEAEEMKDEDEK